MQNSTPQHGQGTVAPMSDQHAPVSLSLRTIQFAGLSSAQVQHRRSGLNWVPSKHSSCLYRALWDDCGTGVHMAQIDVLAVVKLHTGAAVACMTLPIFCNVQVGSLLPDLCSSRIAMYSCTRCYVADAFKNAWHCHPSLLSTFHHVSDPAVYLPYCWQRP